MDRSLFWFPLGARPTRRVELGPNGRAGWLGCRACGGPWVGVGRPEASAAAAAGPFRFACTRSRWLVYAAAGGVRSSW